MVVEEKLRDMGEELGEIKALQRAMLLAVFGGIVALVVDILMK